jgi:hypothetical protein
MPGAELGFMSFNAKVSSSYEIGSERDVDASDESLA